MFRSSPCRGAACVSVAETDRKTEKGRDSRPEVRYPRSEETKQENRPVRLWQKTQENRKGRRGGRDRRDPKSEVRPTTSHQTSTTNQLRNIRISRIRTLGTWDRIRTVPVSSVAERSCVGKVERSGQTVGTAVHRHRAFYPPQRQTHRLRMLHHQREQAKEH